MNTYYRNQRSKFLNITLHIWLLWYD